MNTVPEWLYKYFIAHRGFHNYKSPENSMVAFELAIENNFAIEFDVQILKDSTLVVFHDDNLFRMTGLDKLLSEITYAEIKYLKLLNSDEEIPLLSDVLKLVNGQVPLMIEVKNKTKNHLLEIKLFDFLKEYTGEFVVQSFNPLSLKWFKENANNVIRGQLSYRYEKYNISYIKKIILRNMLLNFISKPDYIMYDINALDSLIIKWLKLRKKIVIGFTAKSFEDYNKSISRAANVCFEKFNPNDYMLRR